jgi:hypothetical protein
MLAWQNPFPIIQAPDLAQLRHRAKPSKRRALFH